MKKITVEMIMACTPCRDYPAERVSRLFKGRESMTLPEIARLRIPILDRLWVMAEFLDWRMQRRVIKEVAKRHLHAYGRGYANVWGFTALPRADWPQVHRSGYRPARWAGDTLATVVRRLEVEEQQRQRRRRGHG